MTEIEQNNEEFIAEMSDDKLEACGARAEGPVRTPYGSPCTAYDCAHIQDSIAK